MDGLIILIPVVVASSVAYILQRFMIVVDRDAAAKLAKVESPANDAGVLEAFGSPLSKVIPNYFKSIENDLYWVGFIDQSWRGRSAAWVVGRQVLMAVGLGVAARWALTSNLGLILGMIAGWTLMQADLSTKAEDVRRRVSREMPETLQLMAAEAASGVGLEEVLRRVSAGEGYLAAWLRRVLSIGHGRGLLSARETGAGVLRKEADRSGHPYLISFAVQLGFVRRGTQVRESLHTLAAQFSESYVSQAEVRAEEVGNRLGIYTALFYLAPFLIVILAIVGVPILIAF